MQNQRCVPKADHPVFNMTMADVTISCTSLPKETRVKYYIEFRFRDEVYLLNVYKVMSTSSRVQKHKIQNKRDQISLLFYLKHLQPMFNNFKNSSILLLHKVALEINCLNIFKV